MVSLSKRLEKMRENQIDWRIEDLLSIAKSLGVAHRSSGGSHVVFRHPFCAHLTVPAKKPIKPIYVRQFIELVDRVLEVKMNESRS